MESCLESLVNCELHDGRLTVPGFSSDRYRQLAQELRVAVINYSVPHWKIIAVYVKLKGLDQFVDFVTKPKNVSKSYAEMVPVLKRVAAARGAIQSPFVQEFGVAYKEVGDLSFIWGSENVISTYNGSLKYEGSNGKIDFLHKVDIVETNSCIMHAIMYKGTGVVSFEEAQKIVQLLEWDQQVNVVYCPMTAVYDLSQFFMVKPAADDRGVLLRYKADIDEAVLQDIFRQFGETCKRKGEMHGSN